MAYTGISSANTDLIQTNKQLWSSKILKLGEYGNDQVSNKCFANRFWQSGNVIIE